MQKTFYVYLLASGPCGWLYVGVTNDLVRRVAEHKHGLIPGYTAERGIDQLVWYETHTYVNNPAGEADQALAAGMEVCAGRAG